MMEAARTSETLVNLYQTTRRYNPEDSHLHVYNCLHININTTIYTGFGNEWCRNHLASPSDLEVRICERSCHIQRQIEIKPRTAITNIDSRQINIFCEIFKMYNVVLFLCSL
jgi:hypothetical protein